MGSSIKNFLISKNHTWTVAQTCSGEETTGERLAQLRVLQERGAVREQLVAILIGEQVGQMNVGDVLLQRCLRIRATEQLAAVVTPGHIRFVVGRCGCEKRRFD